MAIREFVFNAIFVFFLISSFTKASDVSPSWKEGDETRQGSSVAPLFAYEPTYKFIAGAAYFYYGDSFNFGIDGYTNFNQVYQTHIRWKHQFIPRWKYQFYLVGIRGFDQYYGEGGETLVANRTQLWGYRSLNDFSVEYELSKTLFASALFVYRVRGEDSHNIDDWTRRFPDERTLALGLQLRWDHTTPQNEPKKGLRLTTRILHSPHSLSSLENNKTFTQVEGEIAIYQELLEDVSEGIIAAYRIKAGHSIGEPSYLFRYRLGGNDGLAGYFDNRFRGKIFYSQSTEVRYPIWKFFSGALSLAFGDVADNSFTNPKLAYGAGIRIGLPPDWVSKIRIDFQFGRDESGVFVDFGQTF